MTRKRIDHIPPDGWVTKLRAVFGISDDATWADILTECAQTRKLATRETKLFIESQSRLQQSDEWLKRRAAQVQSLKDSLTTASAKLEAVYSEQAKSRAEVETLRKALQFLVDRSHDMAYTEIKLYAEAALASVPSTPQAAETPPVVSICPVCQAKGYDVRAASPSTGTPEGKQSVKPCSICEMGEPTRFLSKQGKKIWAICDSCRSLIRGKL